nr:cysteine-rich repeat secretory protein 15 [Tanacetum cinerariifolium]
MSHHHDATASTALRRKPSDATFHQLPSLLALWEVLLLLSFFSPYAGNHNVNRDQKREDGVSKAISKLKSICGSSEAGDVFLAQCYMRYWASGYYDSPSRSSGDDNNVGKTIAIIVGVVGDSKEALVSFPMAKLLYKAWDDEETNREKSGKEQEVKEENEPVEVAVDDTYESSF